MKHTLILIVVLLFAATGHGQTITLAAYNIENAFDVFDDPYTHDEEAGVKQRAAWQAVAAAIAAMDADVVGFSELENEHVLRAMVSEFLPDAGYEYIASGSTNSTRGINLGIISRLPINRITSYRFRTRRVPGEERTWRFARDLYRVTLDAPDGQTLDVFIVHFKSRRDSPDDPQSGLWRLSEALMARQVIDALLLADPAARVAMLGDFNDTPGDPAISALLEGDRLHDVHSDLPPDQRITYLHEPYRSTIDYILVSPALQAALVPGSARVLSDPELLTGSDHAPIWARFDLTPQ